MENKIDFSQIPTVTVKKLAKETLEAVKRFYEDPENRKRFEEWKKESDAAEATRSDTMKINKREG